MHLYVIRMMNLKPEMKTEIITQMRFKQIFPLTQGNISKALKSEKVAFMPSNDPHSFRPLNGQK